MGEAVARGPLRSSERKEVEGGGGEAGITNDIDEVVVSEVRRRPV